MASSMFGLAQPTCSIIELEVQAVLKQYGTATARYGNSAERNGNGNFYLTVLYD